MPLFLCGPSLCLSEAALRGWAELKASTAFRARAPTEYSAVPHLLKLNPKPQQQSSQATWRENQIRIDQKAENHWNF
eukprot:3827688-Amphidinium_carterae.1